MDPFVGILIVVLLIRWVVLSRRLGNIERRLEDEGARSRKQIADLVSRIYALEKARLAPPAALVSETVAAPVASPVVLPPAVVLPPPVTLPSPVDIPPPTAVPPLPSSPPPPESVRQRAPAFNFQPQTPKKSWQDSLREHVGDEGWEAMVGGSWLNKLGVLVLVIGVALLLGYEFARVGPAGRVGIGLAVSLTLLVGGVLIERRPAYAVFARGLIGGGWAALYFTTYAMHAVDAAKVIENTYLGASLLLAVALGMILHSLQYKSQTVTGLAYFIAFATLSLTESTPFSVIALIPLAASLLVLAYRFEWTKMAVFGLLATYATCASRPDNGAPLASTQALFGTYWLLFETFDLLRLRRRAHGFAIESLILPINAVGFLGLSLVKWDRMAHGLLYEALAGAAALYLLSALLRVRLSPPSSWDGTETIQRMAGGAYEGPITLSAILAAVSIFQKAPGMWINVGLLIEGELLFLAGVRFGQEYLRQLAGAAFTVSLAKLLWHDLAASDTTTIAKRQWMTWTPATLLTAALFYVNRILRVSEGWVYSTVAAALIALVLGFETPHQYLSVSWLAFAAVLFELGFRTEKEEFQFQSYALGLLGTGSGFFINISAGDEAWRWPWLPMAISAALHYAAALRIRFGAPERLKQNEGAVCWITSASASAFLMAIAWKLAPGDYLGVAWLALGALLFELGLRRLPSQLRGHSYAVSAAGFLNLGYQHVVLANKGSSISEPISLGFAALICYGLSARLLRPMPERIEDEERGWSRDLYTAAATLFVLTLAWLKLPAPVVALAWAVVSLVLLEIGFSCALARFRAIGNLVAAAAFGRLFLANFTDFGNTLRISHRMLTVVPIVLSEYYVWTRYRRAEVGEREQTLVRLYLYAPAILGVALMRFELGRSLAVVGWAFLCLALYRTGLVSEIADLRWQSYAIAALAFWRCWNTNFYIPENLGGIQARDLEGAAVIACFYCAQLISPRYSTAQSSGGRAWLHPDDNARGLYSLLASVLLAVLLFYEVSGSNLTMAWGVEGMALLAAGFPLRDRPQRISGLFLFMVCVLKLFLYDLRQLETISRIISFIVLGLILVSVSWVYTRFRTRIQSYL